MQKFDMKSRRLELQLTLEQVGKHVGVGKSTVKKWETGYIENMKRDKIALLAEVLRVSPLDIMGISAEEVPKTKIPVLGYVRAGVPIEAVEEILDYEEITLEMATRGEYFALQIKGDSMEPKFSEGDVVIVRRQPDVESGNIAVILVNGNDATIKKVKKREDGIELIPSNPSYDVKFYSIEDMATVPVNIIGKVVELRAKF